MSWEGKLNKIDDNRWEIPMDESKGMRTNAVIYASEEMLSQIRSDNAPMQAANVACLPGPKRCAQSARSAAVSSSNLCLDVRSWARILYLNKKITSNYITKSA